jgi:hypothetical protein
MGDEIPSKEYSWEFLTASRRLETGPCELVYANVVASATTPVAALYDGTDTTGKEIIPPASAAAGNIEFRPSRPVYCAKGLYVSITSAVTGIFVLWRKL